MAGLFQPGDRLLHRKRPVRRKLRRVVENKARRRVRGSNEMVPAENTPVLVENDRGAAEARARLPAVRAERKSSARPKRRRSQRRRRSTFMPSSPPKDGRRFCSIDHSSARKSGFFPSATATLYAATAPQPLRPTVESRPQRSPRTLSAVCRSKYAPMLIPPVEISKKL